MPSLLCHVLVVQRWPSVQPRFHDRRARPRSQRIVRVKLARRLVRALRMPEKWRTLVAMRETSERRETVKSCGILVVVLREQIWSFVREHRLFIVLGGVSLTKKNVHGM